MLIHLPDVKKYLTFLSYLTKHIIMLNRLIPTRPINLSPIISLCPQ